MEIVAQYVILVIIGCIIAYGGMRTIDYLFTKKEDDRRYGYDLGKIEYACKHGKKMAMSITKEINDNLIDSYKKFMEDL